MNIYLIGMPGCGKSTIGKVLADKLNFSFTDTDQLIEKQKNMSINDIFYRYDENYFRQLETAALKDLNKNNNHVIATGGGIILKEENKKLMNGIVIYLKTDIDLLTARINDNSRPLLKTKSLSDIFSERKEKYLNFADKVVDISNLTIEDCVNMIIYCL